MNAIRDEFLPESLLGYSAHSHSYSNSPYSKNSRFSQLIMHWYMNYLEKK
jgi:hypothetical protein